MSAEVPPDASPRPTVPRRIAFCITDLDVGGAEQCLVNIACGLDRRDWSPRVFCLSRRGALVDRLEQAGIPCTCLGWRGLRDVWRFPALVRELRQWRPELLQTFLFHGNMAGRITGALARVPVIVSGIRVAEREKSWHVQLERLTRSLVTNHVCVSPQVATFSIRDARLRPDTVTVIPNGVEVGKFQGARPIPNAELGAPPDTKWMIAVGRLHPQKGHRLLIEAVAPLLKPHADWRLMIVGEGPLRGELQKQIDELGCRDRIVLLGFRDDVPRLLKSASLFVLPSLWEGQPNVVSEAMAAHLPVIATDVEGVRRPLEFARPQDESKVRPIASGSVEDGVTGLIVPPGEVAALRDALSSVLRNEERLNELASGTYLASRFMLTTELMVRQYADLYEQLLNSVRC
ncbi:MAG: glycosyltransferase [Planctomycetaceae bacterium]